MNSDTRTKIDNLLGTHSPEESHVLYYREGLKRGILALVLDAQIEVLQAVISQFDDMRLWGDDHVRRNVINGIANDYGLELRAAKESKDE